MNLRVVFDTSSLVSAAILPDSIPNQALQHAILHERLFVGEETLGELGRVLNLRKFDRYLALESRIEFFEGVSRDSSRGFVPAELLDDVRGSCRDAKDEQFLALCIAVNADLLVSSDEDLLTLNPWRGIRILTPSQFLSQFSI
jgi:putative PIN family toxin of toxin-antitoxin system